MDKEFKNQKVCDLMFMQQMQGMMCLALEDPVPWNEAVDKEETLEYIFSHMRVSEANEALLQMLGIDREDFIGKNLSEIHELGILQSKDLWIDFFDRGFRSGITKIVLPGGDVQALEGNSMCIYDENERVVGLLSLQRDVTIQETLENDLKKREQLLAAVAKLNTLLLHSDNPKRSMSAVLEILGRATTADRVYVFENHTMPDSEKIYCSQKFEWTNVSVEPQLENQDLQGFPLEEGLNRWFSILNEGGTLNSIVHDLPEDERGILEAQHISAILLLPIFVHKKFWGFIGFDNCQTREVWSQSHIDVLESSAANIGMAIEHYLTKKELADRNEIFSLIADNIDEMFYLRTPDMNFQYVNKASEELLGLKQEALLEDGSVFTKLIHPEDLEKLRHNLSENTDQSQYRIVREDGSIRYLTNRRFPIFDENNQLQGYAGVVNDTTALVKAQQELEQALTEERGLHELKNRFISMISHEIRTPLTAIVSSAELLEEFSNKLEDNQKEKLVSRILKGSDRITELLEDVLLIGKADAGKLQLQSKEISISDFIKEIDEEMKLGYFKDRELEIDIDLSKDKIKADKKLLRHIMVNLIENAAKYSDKTEKVMLSVSNDNSSIQFVVQDFGSGIPEPDIENIFNPFFRGKGVENIEGTGLGMSIVKRAVEVHGGSINIQSVPSKGTSVTVNIPFR